MWTEEGNVLHSFCLLFQSTYLKLLWFAFLTWNYDVFWKHLLCTTRSIVNDYYIKKNTKKANADAPLGKSFQLKVKAAVQCFRKSSVSSLTGSQWDVNKAIKLGKSVSQQKPQNEPKEALTPLKITFMAWKRSKCKKTKQNKKPTKPKNYSDTREKKKERKELI